MSFERNVLNLGMVEEKEEKEEEEEEGKKYHFCSPSKSHPSSHHLEIAINYSDA